MVSPTHLDRASTTAAKMPGRLLRTTTLRVVCQWVAPRAVEASRRSCDTVEKISTNRLIKIGSTITESTSEAVSREYPKRGISVRMPQTP